MKKVSAQEQIRSQPKWHKMIRTVPSIPDKTQVFFISEDEEEVQANENLSHQRISEVYEDFKDPKVNMDMQPYLNIPAPRMTKSSFPGTIEQPSQQEAVTDMTNKHQQPFSNLDSNSTSMPVTA